MFGTTSRHRHRKLSGRHRVADRHLGDGGHATELVELVWIPLKEAETLDLPHITSVVLKELDQRLAHGMGHDLPVPFYYEKSRKWFREEL